MVGSVVAMQAVFTTVSGQESAIAIVVSTLIIAALFQPLRNRIQGWIDRRFFRTKYDANQTLQAFAETARDEVDLEQLSMSLMQAVNETLRPQQAWLWLKQFQSPQMRDRLFQELLQRELFTRRARGYGWRSSTSRSGR